MSTVAEKAADAADRALIRLLLETHSQKDVLALMQCTVSGRTVTHGQVRRQRRNMLEKGALARRKRVRPTVIEVVMPVAVKRRDPGEPETFESQMARLAAGAGLVAAPDFRTPPPNVTLGGVGSASL